MARVFVAASTQYLFRAGTFSVPLPIFMSCWCYSDSLTLSQCVMGVFDGGTASASHRLVLGGNVAGDPAQALSTNSAAASATAYPTNRWFHLAGSWRSTTDRRVYLEGIEETNTTSVSVSTLSRLAVGARVQSSVTIPMSGMLAMAAIWTDMIPSKADLDALGRGVPPSYIQSDKLFAYWPLLGVGPMEPDGTNNQHLLGVNSPAGAVHPFDLGNYDFPLGFYPPFGIRQRKWFLTPAGGGGGGSVVLSAKYSVLTTKTTATKSAKYSVITTATIAKSTKYSVLTTIVSKTLSAIYRVIRSLTANTKTAKYSVNLSNTTETVSARYAVITNRAKQLTARYVVQGQAPVVDAVGKITGITKTTTPTEGV